MPNIKKQIITRTSQKEKTLIKSLFFCHNKFRSNYEIMAQMTLFLDLMEYFMIVIVQQVTR